MDTVNSATRSAIMAPHAGLIVFNYYLMDRVSIDFVFLFVHTFIFNCHIFFTYLPLLSAAIAVLVFLFSAPVQINVCPNITVLNSYVNQLEFGPVVVLVTVCQSSVVQHSRQPTVVDT